MSENHAAKRYLESLHSITAVLENMNSAAALITLAPCRFLTSNSEMTRKHGVKFEDASELALKTNGRLRSGKNYFLKLNRLEEVPTLEECKDHDAEFELLCITRTTALLRETAKRGNGKEHEHNLGSVEAILNQGHDSNQIDFQFSYTENLFTGKRSYTPPPKLSSMLAVSDASGRLPEWRNLIVEKDRPMYYNAISELKQHGGNCEIQYRINLRDNTTMLVTDYFTMTTPDGKWPLIAGTVVSSRRSYEEIQTAERLILQARLIGGMVHDFKNLIGGIQNIIEWSVTKTTDPKLAEALTKTLSYTSQAVKLISGTLKLGSHARAKDAIEKVNLCKIISEIEDIIRRSLPASIELCIRLPENEHPVIYAQKEAIKDLILNLCLNAKDAMKERGSLLTVGVSSVTDTDESGMEQPYAVITVEDNGCGMTDHQIRNVFEAFYSTKETGAGLGLWMVREAVRNFDGKIDLRSKLGEGACFELRFPAVKTAKHTDEHAHGMKVQSAACNKVSGKKNFSFKTQKTILIIEDDPLIRSSVAAWLESLGFKIVESDNGTKGLEIFKTNQGKIDLVIQDYIIPGLHGDALLDGLLSHDPNIPVIVASANPDEDKIDALKKRGAFDFLPKPFRIDELTDIVQRVFQTEAE